MTYPRIVDRRFDNVKYSSLTSDQKVTYHAALFNYLRAGYALDDVVDIPGNSHLSLQLKAQKDNTLAQYERFHRGISNNPIAGYLDRQLNASISPAGVLPNQTTPTEYYDIMPYVDADIASLVRQVQLPMGYDAMRFYTSQFKMPWAPLSVGATPLLGDGSYDYFFLGVNLSGGGYQYPEELKESYSLFDVQKYAQALRTEAKLYELKMIVGAIEATPGFIPYQMPWNPNLSTTDPNYEAYRIAATIKKGYDSLIEDNINDLRLVDWRTMNFTLVCHPLQADYIRAALSVRQQAISGSPLIVQKSIRLVECAHISDSDFMYLVIPGFLNIFLYQIQYETATEAKPLQRMVTEMAIAKTNVHIRPQQIKRLKLVD